MDVPPGVALQKFRGGDPQALLQAQNVVGGKNQGSFAAAGSETGDPGVAAEPKAALRSEFHRAHYLEVQINHKQLLII